MVVDGSAIVAFASNDYLGLAGHPALAAAMHRALDAWGAGAGASHLVAGHMAPHALLERDLAAFVAPCADARALTFSAGYLANLGILTALAGRGAAVFADRLNHASLNDGALLSRADFVRYPHRNVAALAGLMARSPARRKVIATDAVFSMDGTIAPVPELLALAEAHDALLVVDDAHGFGVLGEGRGTRGAFRPRLRSSRDHGHARQGGGHRRGIRRGASGHRRHPRANRAALRVHDRRAADARGGTGREPRGSSATRTSSAHGSPR